MGYYVNGGGNIILRADTPKPILDRIKEIAEDAFSDYSIHQEPDGTYLVEAYNNEKYHEDVHFEYLCTIEPYVIEGSLEFQGDDSACWQDLYDPDTNKWIELPGHIVYERENADPIYERMQKNAKSFPHWYKKYLDNVEETKTLAFLTGKSKSDTNANANESPKTNEDAHTKAIEETFGVKIPDGYVVDSCRIRTVKIGGDNE